MTAKRTTSHHDARGRTKSGRKDCRGGRAGLGWGHAAAQPAGAGRVDAARVGHTVQGMENDVADVQGGGKTRGCQSKPILKKPSLCLKEPAAAKAKVIKKPAANFSAEAAASRAKIRAMSRSKKKALSEPKGLREVSVDPRLRPIVF